MSPALATEKYCEKCKNKVTNAIIECKYCKDVYHRSCALMVYDKGKKYKIKSGANFVCDKHVMEEEGEGECESEGRNVNMADNTTDAANENLLELLKIENAALTSEISILRQENLCLQSQLNDMKVTSDLLQSAVANQIREELQLSINALKREFQTTVESMRDDTKAHKADIDEKLGSIKDTVNSVKYSLQRTSKAQARKVIETGKENHAIDTQEPMQENEGEFTPRNRNAESFYRWQSEKAGTSAPLNTNNSDEGRTTHVFTESEMGKGIEEALQINKAALTASKNITCNKNITEKHGDDLDTERVTNEDEWTDVKSRKKQKERNRPTPLRGTSTEMHETTKLRAVIVKKWFFVSGFEPNTEPDELKNYLENILKIDMVTCHKMTTKHSKQRSSFRVGIPATFKNVILNSNNWPEGVIINYFLNI